MEVLSIANDLVPEEQKTKEWMKNKFMSLKTMATHDSISKRKDIESWYMYHNIWNEKEFDYLTRVPNGTQGESDYFLPAKVRHIPIQRTKLNVLISQQRYRPFNFSTQISDKEGRSEKLSRQIHEYVGAIIDQLSNTSSQISMQIEEMSEQLQQIEQQLQQEPRNQQESEQLQLLAQQRPLIQQQINLMQKKLHKELLLNEKDVKKMNVYYMYEKKDWVEDKAEKMCKMLRDDLRIEEKSLTNFISHVVTGKQAYYIDYKVGEKQIDFEPLEMINVFYPSVDNCKWIQNLPWVVIKRTVTLNYAMSKYNLSQEEAERLKAMTYVSAPITNFLNTSFGSSMSGAVYAGTLGNTEGIPEYRIWFKSPRLIQAKKSPNQYKKGSYFTHFLDDKPKKINEGSMKWNNKKLKYIDIGTQAEYAREDIINVTKGEKLEQRYVDDIYEGVILGNDLLCVCEKKQVRITSSDNYSTALLPVVGKAFNAITDRPYSLIWETKDLQKTYNILNFHRELMLATSGVKGSIMDMSQKPEGFTVEQWLYYKKLGTMWIETVKKSGRTASFNQFQQFDDSVSSSIQYIDNMMAMTDEMLGNIIGVTRQRQGQVINTDQVGTYGQSIQQSSLVTEIIFAEHDEIERQALEVALNLASKYVYKDGGVFSYNTDNLSSKSFTVPAKILSDNDFTIKVSNNTEEVKKISELKQFVMNEYSRGQLPFKDMIKLYNTDTLTELQKSFEYFMDEALSAAQENAQASNEAEIQSKERMMQLQGKIDMQIQANQLKLKEMELQMKSQLQKMDIDLKQKELEASISNNLDVNKIQLLKTNNEAQIEGAYIQEQARSNQTDERLKAIELKMKMLLDKVGASSKDITKGKDNRGLGLKPKERILD